MKGEKTMKASYTFDGTVNAKHIQADYDYRYYPETRYDPADDDLNVHTLIIDGIHINNENDFWDIFGTDDDPDNIYGLLVDNANDIDGKAQQEIEASMSDFELSDEERQVMADIRAERESV